MRGYLGLWAFIVLFIAGCGGGSGSGEVAADGGAGGTPTVGFTDVVVNQSIAARAIPPSIDTVRITGYRLAIINGVLDPVGGGVTVNPKEFAVSNTYRLEDVPTDTTAFQIEYLDGGQVVGLYVEDGVTLTPGQVYEINEPAFVSAPDGVTSFDLYISDAYPIMAAPPGELPVVTTQSFPRVSFSVPELPSLESIFFDNFGTVPVFDPENDGDISEEIRAFTVFTSSDQSVARVGNSGLFNSTFQSGTLTPLQPGNVTIFANFLGISNSVELRVVEPGDPTVLIFPPAGLLEGDRYVAKGSSFSPSTGEIRDDFDFTSELIFRPSDKPNVARWDDAPGREGFVIRGNQPGRVILWAYHPRTPIWLPIPVVNGDN